MNERISPGDASERLISLVAVDHQLLARAKDAVIKRVLEGTRVGHSLRQLVVADLGVTPPPKLQVDLTLNANSQLRVLAESARRDHLRATGGV